MRAAHLRNSTSVDTPTRPVTCARTRGQRCIVVLAPGGHVGVGRRASVGRDGWRCGVLNRNILGSRIGIPYRIGRGRSNELQISDDGKVSRYHCKLVRDGRTFRLVDSGSVNGTLVNDERVDERVLKVHDRLTIGRVKFVFRYATEQELAEDDLVDELLPEGF